MNAENPISPDTEADEDALFDEDEGDDFDLRPVSATQIACPGYDLIDLLCYDEDVTPKTLKRLHLTMEEGEPDPETGFAEPNIPELDPEAFYLITFPVGTDFENFTVADALSVENFPEKCFNDLATDDSEMACDGNCEACPQDCIGKRPVSPLYP